MARARITDFRNENLESWTGKSDEDGRVSLELFRECDWEIVADDPVLGSASALLREGDSASSVTLDLSKERTPRDCTGTK